MKKRYWVLFFSLIFLWGAVTSCELLLTKEQQAAIQALTPDQKARLVADGMQAQLERDFISCKAYVDRSVDPAVKAAWKGPVINAFDKANKTLGTMITTGGLISGTTTGNMTPDEVYAKMQPLLQELIVQLVSIGFKKK